MAAAVPVRSRLDGLVRIVPALPRFGLAVALAAAAPALGPRGAAAQDATSPDQPVVSTQPTIATSLPANGDPLGTREELARRGIRYNAIYTGEVLGNVAGGLKRGAVYQGKLEINTTWDFEKLVGWQGLTFYVNGFQTHQTAGIARRYVGTFRALSTIEAFPATRLSELWVEQKLFDGTFGIRIGQLVADTEFQQSDFSQPLLTNDFPAKYNLPSGGPTFPLATPGIRLRWDPQPAFSLLGAVFNGNPAGTGDIPEVLNRNGVNFRLRDPALVMTEAQFRYNQEAGLAGALRFGAWTHLGRFDDQRFDVAGLPLASPDSSGVARRLRGNRNIYAVFDQQVWRPEGGDSKSGIGVFAVAGASPSDRNPMSFYLDGGITFAGLIPSRPNDIVSAGFLYTGFSADGRAFDRDVAAFTGMPKSLRSYELALEATYVAQIRPGWTVQPDIQYVVRPNGDLSATGRVARNATILGLRTQLTY